MSLLDIVEKVMNSMEKGLGLQTGDKSTDFNLIPDSILGEGYSPESDKGMKKSEAFAKLFAINPNAEIYRGKQLTEKEIQSILVQSDIVGLNDTKKTKKIINGCFARSYASWYYFKKLSDNVKNVKYELVVYVDPF